MTKKVIRLDGNFVKYLVNEAYDKWVGEPRYTLISEDCKYICPICVTKDKLPLLFLSPMKKLRRRMKAQRKNAKVKVVSCTFEIRAGAVEDRKTGYWIYPSTTLTQIELIKL